ncbi:hypothetical protein [Streptomyces sp. NRRL WC-3618]|uniref:hypothetical protein n=1 Tax=Streptomyces sp. NRRL WC-3618 TaxID=1519490 RepID=UPI0006AEDCF3|nr:hypothetical protein [Streptomyces sp. NRRL WC-3618]
MISFARTVTWHQGLHKSQYSSFLLGHDKLFDRKLEDSDPAYRGIKVPLRFWKVTTFMQAGHLASTAYFLDQTPGPAPGRCRPGHGRSGAGGRPSPLGAFRAFQLPVVALPKSRG